MYFYRALLACILFVSPAYADPLNLDKPITLEQAIARATDYSPDLQGADASYRAAKGERRQASALLNPELSFEIENLAGGGSYRGTDQAETTIAFAQTIEIGGKRSARIKAADQGETIAELGRTRTKNEMLYEVRTAFANAVLAQEEYKLATEQVTLARSLHKNVSKRVQAAADPAVQRHKSGISLAKTELTQARAKSKKLAMMKILFSYWGDADKVPLDKITLSSDTFYAIHKPQADNGSNAPIQDTLDYRQQSLAVEQANSYYDLERANAVPNPTIAVGVRDFRATDNQALVASVSFPLPVFDMNRGNIEKARQIAVKADTDRRKHFMQTTSLLAEHRQLLEAAYLSANALKTSILPEAKQAFFHAQKGYGAGRLAYMDVLDAQRTLIETRQEYIQTLRDYHVEKASLDRLTAKEETIFPSSPVTGDKK